MNKQQNIFETFLNDLINTASVNEKKFTVFIKNNTPPITEKGALGERTDIAIVDFNFNLPKFRTNLQLAWEKIDLVLEQESIETVARYLFYLRDIREGIGERVTFRFTFLKLLSVIRKKYNNEVVYKLLKLVPEYGRYDDLIEIYFINSLDREINKIILQIICEQLNQDVENAMCGKPISLLAKWLPSAQTTDPDKKRFVRILLKNVNLSISQYRKILSKLRKYLDVVEVKMSSNNWNEIDYEKVPSKANLLYKNAFFKHDEERRSNYLDKVQNNKAKMNASVLFPYEIVKDYGNYRIDRDLELLWKNLDKNMKINPSKENKVLTVLDTSGSMSCTIMDDLRARDVANSIAIYASEHLNGVFKDKTILFSSKPKFIDFSLDNSLFEKLARIKRYNDISNTNIMKVFQLILDIAIRNNLKQSEIPQTLLIISDMEFDRATTHDFHNSQTKTLFESIESDFRRQGYMLPKLVFWNVNSRTGVIPMTKNYAGVTLVSGFSKNIFKSVLNNDLDPYISLINIISDKRYDPVSKALALN